MVIIIADVMAKVKSNCLLKALIVGVTVQARNAALGNPLLDSVNHRGGTASDADLVVDVLQVVFDCFPADNQGLRDLGVTLALG